MPAKFEACLRSKGRRVRTIKPRSDVYIHLCYRRNSNKAVAGEVKHLKSSRYHTKRIIKRKITSK